MMKEASGTRSRWTRQLRPRRSEALVLQPSSPNREQEVLGLGLGPSHGPVGAVSVSLLIRVTDTGGPSPRSIRDSVVEVGD